MSIRANSQWYSRCLMTAMFVAGVLGTTVYGQVYQGNQYGFSPIPSHLLDDECVPCPFCHQHCVCFFRLSAPLDPTPYGERGGISLFPLPGSSQRTVPDHQVADSSVGDTPPTGAGTRQPPPRPAQPYDEKPPEEGEKPSEEGTQDSPRIDVASSQRDLSSIPGFGSVGERGITGVTGSAVPNMIGDSSSIPTRSLTYYYKTWQSTASYPQLLESWTGIADYYDMTLTDLWFKKTTGYERNEYLKAHNYSSFESLYRQIENSPAFPITSVYTTLDNLHQNPPPGGFTESYLTQWVSTNAPFVNNVDEFVEFLANPNYAILSDVENSVLKINNPDVDALLKLQCVLEGRGLVYRPGYWGTADVWHDGHWDKEQVCIDGEWEKELVWRDGYWATEPFWHDGYWEDVDADYFGVDQSVPASYTDTWEEVAYEPEPIPIASTPSMYMTMLNMAENFNAQIQDRIYFDLRFFGGAQGLGSRKVNNDGVPTADLARATMGFEKIFLRNRSVELRIPVIMTMNSGTHDARTIGSTRGNQIGNISVIYKYAFQQRQNFTLSRGIGINFPTAPGIRMHFLSEAGRPVEGFIDNAKMSFIPYIGGNWQSSDQQSFAHGIAQLDIAVGNNRLRLYDTTWFGQRDEYRTSLHESSLARLNFGGGRWLINQETENSRFRLGVAAECHYTANFDKLGTKNLSGRIPGNNNSFSVSETKGHWQMINLVFGLPIQTQKTAFSPFISTPISSTRYFDVEGGFSFDVRF